MGSCRRPSLVPRRGCRPGSGLLLAACAGLAGQAAGQCQPVWTAVSRNQLSWALTIHDEDGPGGIIPPAIYAGDMTVTVQGVDSPNVARFDGWRWYTVGAGLNEVQNTTVVRAFASHPHAFNTVPRGLFVVGAIHWSGQRRLSRGPARWDGNAWNGTGESIRRGGLFSVAVWQAGGVGPEPAWLYASGTTRGHRGDPEWNEGILRWDGVDWSSVGGGLAPFAHDGPNYALAFALYDEDGEGPRRPELFLGGSFAFAGGVRINNLAKWDGTAWTSREMDGCSPSPVRALCVFDEDGPGPRRPALFCGGGFTRVGPPWNSLDTRGGLARWDGETWSEVAGWDGGNVWTMGVFDDDGSGPNRPALFVTGTISRVQGMQPRNICKWDGENWHMLGSGLGGISPQAKSFAFLDEDGAGPNPGGVYVAGEFFTAGGLWTPGFARWGCPLEPRCEADCDTSSGRGRLDVFDFLCFQNRYDGEDPWACDCDTSTGARVCDLFDFLCFQNHFATGCP